MTSDITNKDKQDWENFILSKNKLPNKDVGDQKKNPYKVKSIDLHGHTLDEANFAIEKFIKNSYSDRINKLIVVTGKGLHSQNDKNPYVSKDLSILRYSVPEFIKQNKSLMSLIYDMCEAKVEDGGSGAFYIFLKKKKL